MSSSASCASLLVGAVFSTRLSVVSMLTGASLCAHTGVAGAVQCDTKVTLNSSRRETCFLDADDAKTGIVS